MYFLNDKTMKWKLDCHSINNKLSLFTYLLIVCIVLFCSTVNCDDNNSNQKNNLNQNNVNNILSSNNQKQLVPALQNPNNSEQQKDDDSKEQEDKKSNTSSSNLNNFGFIHAFLASLSVIVVSEIGDKTFFIAAIMAMKHSRFTVYTGAMFALGLMTALSAVLGNILTKLIPKTYTYYASSVLFALFGLKMLKEGYEMNNSDANDEYEEASSTLRESEEKNSNLLGKDLEAGGAGTGADESKNSRSLYRRFVIFFRKYLSAVFLQAFVLTFLAEWGDRSQISTIILGARENILGTIIGGTLGHGLCTGLAVIGGRMISQRISVKTVTLAGAFVFLFFAFSAFFIDPELY